MIKKIDLLSAMMRKGEWAAAIRFASRFPRLGAQRDAILSASSALLSPDFYKSIGKDPDKLVADAIAALKERYPGHF